MRRSAFMVWPAKRPASDISLYKTKLHHVAQPNDLWAPASPAKGLLMLARLRRERVPDSLTVGAVLGCVGQSAVNRSIAQAPPSAESDQRSMPGPLARRNSPNKQERLLLLDADSAQIFGPLAGAGALPSRASIIP